MLPDGPKTHVVGSWSAVKSVGEAVRRCEAGDKVLVYPLDEARTPYEEEVHLDREVVVTGSGCGDDPVDITAAKGETLAASLGVELQGCTVTGVNDQPDAGPTLAHAAGVQKGWFLAAVDGKETHGKAEALDSLWSGAGGSIAASFKASLTGDERPVMAGGIVVTAKNVVLSDLILRGGVNVQDGGLTATGCLFSDASNLLTLWPYTKPHIQRCRFTSATKSCVYCFPHSAGTIEHCDLSPGGGGEGSSGVFADNGNTTFVSNTIRGHSTAIYITCDAGADKGRLNKPLFQGNEITDASGTGVHLDNASDATFKKNTIRRCGHWGITVSGKAKGTFSHNVVDCRVRIMQGSRPQFVSNLISDRVTDHNDQGTSALDETY